MISKEHRFHGTASLRYVFGRGQTVRGPLFVIKYTENKRRNSYRAVVIVSKKVSKSAVVRNRIRRRLYELLRQYEKEFVAPYDIVISVYSEHAATLKSPKLNTQLQTQLKKAKIIA